MANPTTTQPAKLTKKIIKKTIIPRSEDGVLFWAKRVCCCCGVIKTKK